MENLLDIRNKFVVKEAEWLPDCKRVFVTENGGYKTIYVKSIYMIIFLIGSMPFELKLNKCVEIAKEKINSFVDDKCDKLLNQ